MKVIVKKWSNGAYSVKDEFKTKKEFIDYVEETKMPVTDGKEHLSDFIIAVDAYIERNGNYRLVSGKNEYEYKRGYIIETNTVTGEVKKYKL